MTEKLVSFSKTSLENVVRRGRHEVDGSAVIWNLEGCVLKQIRRLLRAALVSKECTWRALAAVVTPVSLTRFTSAVSWVLAFAT